MKYQLLLFFVLFTICVSSQPVITHLVHAPKVGLTNRYITFQVENDQYFDVDPGSEGINKAWNFANFKNGTVIHHSYLDPNVLRLKDTIKNLDITVLNSINSGKRTEYNLLKVTDSELYSRGLTNDTIISRTLPSPLLMKFPLKYGDKFETKGGLRFGNNITFLSVKSIIQTEADAYGSLLTADRKYDQVLRVRSYSIDSIHIVVDNNFKLNLVDTAIYYQWFVPDKGGAVFQLNTIIKNGKIRGEGYSYLTSVTTHTDYTDMESAIVYPNPFTDNIVIQTPTSSQNFQLSIFSADGKLITNFAPETSSDFDFSSLAEGVYFIQISSASKIVKTIKVVKK